MPVTSTSGSTKAVVQSTAPVNLVTVVWGDWHLSAFLDLNLPTLLAARNLPSLVEQCSVSYDIYTRAEDVETLDRNALIKLLRELMTVRIGLISREQTTDPIRAHGELWCEAIERAKREGAAVALIPPDVAWSDGAFSHLAKLRRRGKKVIFNFYLRVVSDAFASEFIKRYRDSAGLIAIPPRELVELSMHYVHPLMAAYCRGSENFPYHPEMVIWPVRGEGLLVRVLARETLMFDPNAYELNDRMLISEKPKPCEFEFISDSDEFFAVSLAPLGKDIEWCIQRRKLEFLWLSRWWLHYDSPTNDFVAATKVCIHHADPTPSLWGRAAFASDVFIFRAIAYREALRVWRALHELKCNRAAEILALAMHTGAIARLTLAGGTRIILAPSDAALDLLPDQELERLASGSGRARIEDLFRAHLIVLGEGEAGLESRLHSGRQIEVQSLAGGRVHFAALGRRKARQITKCLVNGQYVISGSVQIGSNTVLRLEGMLWRAAPDLPAAGG